MASKILWILGSATILILGTLHLYFTFFTEKLFPCKQTLIDEMMKSHPQLTRSTTMWKSWIGFNSSHSTGAIFFGIINIYLAVTHFDLIISDIFIVTLDLTMVGSYCWLAWKYWFKIPLAGIIATSICYILAICLFLNST
jgi:hypothetical protein